MDRYHWLLVFHMVGAFMVLGGAMMAAIFNVTAVRRERPSEVVVLFRLTRYAVLSPPAWSSRWPLVSGLSRMSTT